ncbi:MAG: hypothetical protein AABY64_02480 [Bdellovibrionota bacterium]
MGEKIDKEIKSFILVNIDSVDQLEVLGLLSEHSTVEWTAEAVSRELRSNPDWAKSQLEFWQDWGLLLLNENSTFSYRPANPETAEIIARVVHCYRNNRTSVINLIYDKPSEKIKGLADAFKIRKEE